MSFHWNEIQVQRWDSRPNAMQEPEDPVILQPITADHLHSQSLSWEASEGRQPIHTPELARIL